MLETTHGARGITQFGPVRRRALTLLLLPRQSGA
jgi:hypothetical protein